MRLANLIALTATLVSAQTWADRSEYDLALAVRAQPAPAARLKLLEEWKSKYPNSEMRHARAELALSAAQSAGETKAMLQAATEMVEADPKSFPGLFWTMVLQPGSGASDAGSLTRTASAANQVLALAPAYFASPAAGVTGDAAAAERTRVESMAMRTRGWVLWQQGKTEAAEKDFKASIESDPASATASAWLGSLLASTRLPERQTEALWHLARAAFLDGEGTLPSAQRREVRQLLDAAYASYHGSAEGLDDIGQKTRTSALPPAGFKVESSGEAFQRKQDEEMARTNPELFEWVKIRRRLLAPDGETQFQSMTGAPFPRLSGAVVRCNAASRVSEVVLGLTDAVVEELVMKLDSPLPKCAEPGTRVQFQGTPTAFTREPFLVTVQVNAGAIEGWPAAPGRKR
jgi:hypothetical protein